MKRVLALLGAAAVLTLGAGAIATPAYAATVQDCKEVTTPSVHKQDNGHHGYWADLTFTRTTKICFTGTSDDVSSYKAYVTDAGTLKTIAGAQSPRDGVTILGAVDGTFSGSYEENFTAAGAAWTGYTGTSPAETVTTGDWVKTVYGGEISTNGIQTYEWVYTACCGENWVDGSGNNDGSNSEKDITGKPCPVVIVTEPPVVVTTPPAATTTPPVTTTHTTAPATTTTTAVATLPGDEVTTTTTTSRAAIVPLGNDGATSLPVTGSSLLVPIGAGAALLFVGAGIVLFAVLRRRRDMVRPATLTDDTLIY